VALRVRKDEDISVIKINCVAGASRRGIRKGDICGNVLPFERTLGMRRPQRMFARGRLNP
jgi:hypothetical protein